MVLLMKNFITKKLNKMTNSFKHWTIQDLWKQYQYCQLNNTKFNRNILKKVITEIKSR